MLRDPIYSETVQNELARVNVSVRIPRLAHVACSVMETFFKPFVRRPYRKVVSKVSLTENPI